MNATRRIVLNLSAEHYGRLEAMAAEGRVDAREWVRRAVLTALSRPPTRQSRERRSRQAGLELLSLLAGSTGSGPARSTGSGQAGQPVSPVTERTDHAAHT